MNVLMTVSTVKMEHVILSTSMMECAIYKIIPKTVIGMETTATYVRI